MLNIRNVSLHISRCLNTAVVRLNFAKSLHWQYLCAAYLCICVPVNSQFKYLSNIPLQYRRVVGRPCPLETAINSMFFSANSRSRSLTYDKQKKIKSGREEGSVKTWVGNSFAHSTLNLLSPLQPSIAWELEYAEIQMFKIDITCDMQ